MLTTIEFENLQKMLMRPEGSDDFRMGMAIIETLDEEQILELGVWYFQSNSYPPIRPSILQCLLENVKDFKTQVRIEGGYNKRWFNNKLNEYRNSHKNASK